MSFVRKLSLTLLTNIIVIVLGGLNYIIIIRATSASGQGLFTLVITSMTVILTILGGGAILEANRYLAKKNRDEVNLLFTNSLVFAFGIIVILFLWLRLFKAFPLGYFLDRNMILILLFSIPFIFIQEANKGILWGLERINRHNIVNISRAGFLLVSNYILLVLLRKQIDAAILGWGITLALVAFISILFVVAEKKNFSLALNKEVALKTLNLAGRTFLISILFILSIRADVYIIKFFLDDSAVGYYSVVMLIAVMVNLTPTVGGMLIFNKAVTQENKSIEETAKLSRTCLAYSFFVSLLLIFFGKAVITFLLGSDFAQSYTCLLFYLPALIAQNFAFVISMFISGREGFPAFNIISLLFPLIVGIIFGFILIPVFGIRGAAISASISAIIRAIMNILYFKAKTSLTFSDFLLLRRSDIDYLKSRLLNRVVL